MAQSITAEIAAAAARFIVEEGMEYGPAKRRAAKLLGKRATSSVELPGNDVIEDEVRAHISLFHAETQPAELAELRRIALKWMERMAEFQPHLAGAVWNGTATRRNDVWINLFCEDSKSAEIALINQRVEHDVGSITGFRGEEVDVLSVSEKSREFGMPVLVHLGIYDLDDLRGALKADARGRTARGSLASVRALVEAQA